MTGKIPDFYGADPVSRAWRREQMEISNDNLARLARLAETSRSIAQPVNATGMRQQCRSMREAAAELAAPRSAGVRSEPETPAPTLDPRRLA